MSLSSTIARRFPQKESTEELEIVQ